MLKQNANNPSFCIFANFFIDNEERLQRMKDSFLSFREVNPKEWRVNIRGRLSAAAGEFLRSHLGERLTLFFLESSKGWLYDSKKVMKNARADYVFFWIEDHICLVPPDMLRAFICEMGENKVEYSIYSFLHANQGLFVEFGSARVQGRYLICSNLTNDSCRKFRNYIGRDFYLISCVSITKLDVFLKVLNSSKPILRRWSHTLPFNFEKLSRDNVFRSIRVGYPKIELFACIDDDHGVEGYSLISRGLYPERVFRDDLKRAEFPGKFFPCLKIPSYLAYFDPAYVLLLKVFRKIAWFFRRVYWSVPDCMRVN